MGGRAAAAAEYPRLLCEAFCRGLARQKRYDQQALAPTRRHGRSELKALIRRLTSHMPRAPPSQVLSSMSVLPPDSTNLIDSTNIPARVTDSELEQRVRISKANRYKARRQATKSLQAAIESHRREPPARMPRAEGKKKVRFEDCTHFSPSAYSTACSVPKASWTDEVHEPDGIHPTLIVGDFHLGHAERVRTALRESAGIELDGSMTRPRSPREIAQDMYFTSGTNEGAELLRKKASISAHHQGTTRSHVLTTCPVRRLMRPECELREL